MRSDNSDRVVEAMMIRDKKVTTTKVEGVIKVTEKRGRRRHKGTQKGTKEMSSSKHTKEGNVDRMRNMRGLRG